MVRTASTMMELGTVAPAFSLVDTDGQTVGSESFAGKKCLLVMFICNHCPYVIHVADQLAAIGRDYADRDLQIVAISSNDAEAYPDDAPEKMGLEKQRRGYGFPYCYDGDQSVAKAYGAACTPDFFLFDKDQRLVYRGQLDSSRPKMDPPMPVTGEDLRSAIDAVIEGREVPGDQKPSIGCNIKWKAGEEPAYFGGGG